ncbi:hypothetical protein BDC45DRAFT_517054 [Circinella umbellata]|nr:hypothetical protein BDC45DRAFT_517054 [Circinella umbellata]
MLRAALTGVAVRATAVRAFAPIARSTVVGNWKLFLVCKKKYFKNIIMKYSIIHEPSNITTIIIIITIIIYYDCQLLYLFTLYGLFILLIIIFYVKTTIYIFKYIIYTYIHI